MSNNNISISTNKPYQKARYQRYYANVSRFYKKPVYNVPISLILSIVTIIIFVAFAIRPTLITIAELNKKIEDQTELAEKLQEKAVTLQTIQNQYFSIQDELGLLEKTLPSTDNVESFLEDVEAVAAEQGLPILNMNVLAPVVFEASPSANEEILSSTPIVVNLEGDYQTLRNFLANVSQLPRVKKIKQVSFTGIEEGSQVTFTSEQPLDLTIELFIYHNNNI